LVVQKRRLGRFELCVLDDGSWCFPARFFFGNVPETVWKRRVAVDREGKIPVGHNYAAVRTDDDLIVIDTGYGADTHGGRTGHLLEELVRAGYGREEVTKVVTTHPHGDHIKGNTLVEDGRRQPTFPRARHYLARHDWDWARTSETVRQTVEFDAHLATLDALGLLTLVEGAQPIAPGVSAFPTPGHTPGHTSVLIESAGDTAVVLGDVCHHVEHFSHLDWVSTFDTNPALTPQSRARVLQLAVERNALVMCPHVPYPGLGHVQRTEEGFRWHAVM
jgi:glyoxylase-like metal-dependent hydrolase (beta-lactamase superfamily II)